MKSDDVVENDLVEEGELGARTPFAANEGTAPEGLDMSELL